MRTHRADHFSFASGIVFVLVALVGLSAELGIDVTDVDWLWPVGLIGLGLVVLLSTGLGRRAEDPVEEPPVDAPSDASTAG